MPVKVEEAFLKYAHGPRLFEEMKKKLKDGLLYSKEEVIKMISYEKPDTRFYKMFEGVPKEERARWIVKIGTEYCFGTPKTIKEFQEKRCGFYKGK